MNQEIKERMKAAGVRQWVVADVLGVAEQTLIRWLRFDLSAERREQIIEAIEEAARRKAAVS